MTITTVLMMKRVFGLSLRALQGFGDSIFKLIKLSLHCPDYSLLSKRAKTVNISIKTPTPGEISHLVIDGTGLKVFGEAKIPLARGVDEQKPHRAHQTPEHGAHHIGQFLPERVYRCAPKMQDNQAQRHGHQCAEKGITQAAACR
uniref:Transposase DDE domain-containing protein n=1 Tax=Rhodnius prolixus TaxID=13249 RepID=T1I872_RHOPR